MNLLYPNLQWRWLPSMLKYALLGSIVAGGYGIIHDQITYSISPEYFTRLKFSQFHYADFGLPPRVFVGEIGFLATWWVGFVAGWFVARIEVPAFPPRTARGHASRAFLTILAFALTASIIGYLLGLLRRSNSDLSSWEGFATNRGVLDLPSFVRVAYIHNASYLGGLVGLMSAIVRLRRLKKASEAVALTCQTA
jgi:hypothetical protein